MCCGHTALPPPPLLLLLLQDLSVLPPDALAAVQQRLQPIIDDIQARCNSKSDKDKHNKKKHDKKDEGEKHDDKDEGEQHDKPKKKPSKHNKDDEDEEDSKRKPQKPQKPEKPSLDEKPDKPQKPEGPEKPQKPEKPEKPEKPQQPAKEDGAAKPPALQLPPLPDFSALFNITNLQGLLNGDGSAFNPLAFLQQVANELTKALDRFAQELTGTVLGAPGVSNSDGAQQVLQGLGNSVRSAVDELEKSIASLPRGPVFDSLMQQGVGATTPGGRSSSSLDSLQQLQQQLVSALDGAVNGLNVTSPEQLGQLMRDASSALQSLAGGQLGQQLSQQSTNSGVLGQQSGQLVNQLARSLTPVSEAAGQMLQSFRENLAQMVPPFLGGQ
jgi:hypothetical protein